MNTLIIFDCDGVLIDSEYLSSQIDARELKSLGYQTTAENCLRQFTGKGYSKMRELIKQESGIDIPNSFFLSHQQLVLKELENVKPLLGSSLNFLHNKIPMCIASSSQRNRIITCLKNTGQLSFFKEEHVFTIEQVEKGKPSPDLFLLAAKTMNALPSSCLVIEDSLSGIKAALNAQMNVVAFLGGAHAKFDWYKEGFASYDIPICYTEDELITFLENFLVV